jgi:hypothetical protein
MPVDGLIGQVRGEREKEKEGGQDQAGAAEKPVPSGPPNRARSVGRLRLGLHPHAPILLVRCRSRSPFRAKHLRRASRAIVGFRLLGEWPESLGATWRQLA